MKEHTRGSTDLPLLDGPDRAPRLAMIGARAGFHFDEHPRRALPGDEVDFSDDLPRGMDDDSKPTRLEPLRRQPFAAAA